MIASNARRVAAPPANGLNKTLEDGTNTAAFCEYMESFVSMTEFTICEQSKIDGQWYANLSQSVVGGDTLDDALAAVCAAAGITVGINIRDAKQWLASRPIEKAYADIKAWVESTLYPQIALEFNQEYPTVPTSSTGTAVPPSAGGAPATGFLDLIAFCLAQGKVVRNPATQKLDVLTK